ncbi:MAG: hypothetical protein JWO03_1015 [Bacteroidetes bacterium]|nr:hypothetical protein [Bacteroidota bacterium]
MKRYCTFFVAFFCLTLSSCVLGEKEFYLKTTDETGLKGGEEVCIHGYRIGHVDKTYLTADFKSLAKIIFEKDIILSNDSRFAVKSADLFGAKMISITPGNGKAQIHYGDTLSFSAEENSSIGDSLSVKVGDFLEHVMHKDVDDSLIEEVKKLNDRVDRLDKDIKSR